MTPEQISQELERYRSELTGIMERFVRRPHDYHILKEDDPRFRSFVIEIIDLLNDSIGKNQYSPLINQLFNQGITNYLSTPSYKSIEDIVSVINSVITRLKRNPDFIIKEESTKIIKTDLQSPEKVTLKWLWEHVPFRYLWSIVVVVFFVFSLGITFSHTSLYKSLTDTATAIVSSGKNKTQIRE